MNALNKFFKKLLFNFFYNYRYRKTQNKNTYRKLGKKKIERYYDLNLAKKKIILATQVGRGGGKWLIDIINQCQDVKAFGERNRTEEAKFRHSCSYNKNNGLKRMFHLIKSEALSDWKFSSSSYISSPYFSHGIKLLEKNLRPHKFVIIIRNFDGLLYSLLNKGWYKEDIKLNLDKYHKKTPDAFLSYPSHFYGRYINLEKYNKRFQQSSRAVKVSIFMYQTLKKIYEGLLKVNKNKIEVFNLDSADQNYDYCKNFLQKLNIDLNIGKKKFLVLKKRTALPFDNDKTSINQKDLNKVNKMREKYNYYLKKIKLYT